MSATQLVNTSLTRSLRRSPTLFKLARSGVYTTRALYGRTVGLALRPIQVRYYLKRHDVRGLHLGCASNRLPGWLNTDAFPRHLNVVYLDATGHYRLPDNAFDFVYSEHMIEHVPLSAAQAMLTEAYRVLRPGGVVRVATPDLEKLLALKKADIGEVERKYIADVIEWVMPDAVVRNFCTYLNIFVREWDHTFIYDRATLAALIERVGYSDVIACEVGTSRHPELRGIEHHGQEVGEAANQIETMVLEARKPGSRLR